MSIRVVHIAVISFSILLAFAFGAWGVADWRAEGDAMSLGLGILSGVLGGVLLVYLGRFIKKTKDLR